MFSIQMCSILAYIPELMYGGLVLKERLKNDNSINIGAFISFNQHKKAF